MSAQRESLAGQGEAEKEAIEENNEINNAVSGLHQGECGTSSGLKEADRQQPPHPEASRELWARFYVGRGWPVLPLHTVGRDRCSCGDLMCRSPGKHPRTQHGVKDASIDPEQVRAWWAQWPDANVGIATGAASGIIAIDIDPRNGGDKSYSQLHQDIPGAFSGLLKVRSGSGGTHLYFQHPGYHVPSRANMRSGIDVRADGGYIVAPPSLHMSGARYRFASNSGLLVPPLPPALRDLIAQGAQAQEGGEQSSKIALDSLRVSDAIRALIRNGKPHGQRSEAIFGVLRALIKAGHSDEEIITVLEDPANGLSEKPREKGEAWLRSEIKRAREKPDRDSSASSSPKSNGSVLVSRRASDIQPEAISWLWPQRVALGKLSLIAGQPGLGKSQITTYMAAIVSSGGTWATGEKCEAGDVIIFSAEDDPADTIRPRLEACGADLDRVHIVEAVKGKGRERTFDLNHDIEVLAADLAMRPGTKLVIIDPISAYLGRTNSHNNAEVRGTLAPFAKLTADHRVAIVAVTHLNKGLTPDPLTRVMGSTAFIATVRSAFLIEQDKHNAELRLFLPLKSNISRAGLGLAFRIETHVIGPGIETSKVVWEAEPVTITAAEALAPSMPGDIEDTEEIVAAGLKIFEAEKAEELRSSALNEKLKERGGIEINSKRLKKLLQDVGVRLHERADANYYRRADFAAVSGSTPPSLHPSIPPLSYCAIAQREEHDQTVEGEEAVEVAELS